MGTVFGNIGRAITKAASDIGHEAKRDVNRVTNNTRPDPTKFADGTPVPTSSNSTYQSPSGSSGLTGSGQLPNGGASGYSSVSGGLAGGNQYFTPSQQAQIQSALSASGVWDTIQGLGQDAWKYISDLVNANGGWEKVAKDLGSFVKDDVLPVVSAWSDHERQQQSDKYAQEGLNGSPDGSYEGLLKEYAGKAPLRAAGMAGMLNPSANTPDLSKLAAAGSNGRTVRAPLPMAASPNTNLQTIAGPNSGNPFAPKALPVAQSPMTAPSSSPIPPQQFAPLPLAPSKPPGYNAAGQLNAQTPVPTTPPPVTVPGPLPLAPRPRPNEPTPPKVTMPYSTLGGPLPPGVNPLQLG
jgi:hypothetical protein